MRCLAVLGALCLWTASVPALAQLQVTAQTARSDLIVTVQNLGSTDLVLDNNEGHPWLSFLVSKHNRLPVRPDRDSNFAPLTLKAGETKTLRVNLTPLFAFREEGQYSAAAVVDLPGEGQIISQSVPFEVLNGIKVWSQQRSVDSSQRNYSLVRFSPDADTTRLYLRVEGPDENIVYANLALGELASFIDPEVNFDPKGNLHILQPVALGTYLYTRADPDGKILAQEIFKTYQQIPPRLSKLEDGNVTVIGGLQENPNTPRERLSQAQTVQRTAPAPEAGSTSLDPSAPPVVMPTSASLDEKP
jgi:hypothetical protein